MAFPIDSSPLQTGHWTPLNLKGSTLPQRPSGLTLREEKRVTRSYAIFARYRNEQQEQQTFPLLNKYGGGVLCKNGRGKKVNGPTHVNNDDGGTLDSKWA